jgi:organic radical activating enzyme
VRIVDGKIIPNYACQAEIVSHCNLSCQDCNHLSPIASKRFVVPEAIHRDFSILAKVYRPRFVILTGGEPLLHPDICAVIEAVRSSGISQRIRILTNGLLLPRMGDQFWESIDDLEISIYPNSKLDDTMLQTYTDKAKDFGVLLEVFQFDTFRRTFSRQGTSDKALVKRIYRSCKIAHTWGCHYLDEGFFYKCPQAAFIPRMLELPEAERRRDGIQLRDDPALLDELYAYLTSPEPLLGCKNCLATSGIERPHIQVRPNEWISHQEGPTESLLDLEKMARNEAELHIQRTDQIKELIAYSAGEAMKS